MLKERPMIEPLNDHFPNQTHRGLLLQYKYRTNGIKLLDTLSRKMWANFAPVNNRLK